MGYVILTKELEGLLRIWWTRRCNMQHVLMKFWIARKKWGGVLLKNYSKLETNNIKVTCASVNDCFIYFRLPTTRISTQNLPNLLILSVSCWREKNWVKCCVTDVQHQYNWKSRKMAYRNVANDKNRFRVVFGPEWNVVFPSESELRKHLKIAKNWFS